MGLSRPPHLTNWRMKMKLFGIELSWEVIQTALMLLRTRNPQQTTPASPTNSGRPEEPLKQQTTSVLKPRNDEAIQLAVDAALGKMPNGLVHIKNVRLVRAALAEHQNTDWRKNLGTHELTERFEHVLASETITRSNPKNQQQGQPGAVQGQERIERKFERRPLDYELTAKDPRVQHLILVSKVVSAETDLKLGVVAAKTYLLSAGLISALSPSEKAAAAAKATEAKMTDVINRFVGGVRSDDVEVLRLETAIKSASDADKRQFEEKLKAHFARRAKEANDTRKEKDQIAAWAFRIFLAVVIIIGIVMAARA